MKRAQRLGNQTVTFVSKAPSADTDTLGARLMVETTTDVRYCLHQPRALQGASGAGQIIGEEQPEVGTSVATEWWQTTAPPEPAVLAAKPFDVIRVGGDDFQIISGIKPFVDMSGKVVKVSLISERQTIG